MGEKQSYIREQRLGTLDPKLVDKWGDPTKHPETQLSQDQIDQLIRAGQEMFMSHLTKDGFPIVTVHLYCLRGTEIWSTTVKGRVKEKAYRRDPRCSICISTTGLKLPFDGGICIKTHAEIVEDRAVVDEVCREHGRRYYSDDKAQKTLHRLLFTPNRVAIRFDALKIISWTNVGVRRA
jgi:general stress protein 26